MSEQHDPGSGRLGFLDPLARLFRSRTPSPDAASESTSPLDSALASFDAAILGLEQKIEERRRSAVPGGAVKAAHGATPEERAAQQAALRTQRMQEAHRAILAEIEEMHGRLGTQLAGTDLTELAGFLRELHAEAMEGRGSRSLVPRIRYAVAKRLQQEAGALAVERLVELLRRQGLEWPDATHPRPSASQEEIERSRRRRLGEVRETFLSHDLGRTAQRLLGVVEGWGADYPDPGSPLWQECVLEGVGAGIRARLVREAAELLRRDRDLIFERAQAAIGKEIDTVQAAVEGGVHSLEDANRAVAGYLHVLDDVVPEIAWQHVESQLGRDDS
jgi:hypothetical protein